MAHVPFMGPLAAGPFAVLLFLEFASMLILPRYAFVTRLSARLSDDGFKRRRSAFASVPVQHDLAGAPCKPRTVGLADPRERRHDVGRGVDREHGVAIRKQPV